MACLSVCVGAGVSRGDVAHSSPQIKSLRIGFEGRYKIGYWTTATVVISAPVAPIDGAQVAIETRDGTGVAVRTTQTVTLSTDRASQVVLLIKPGRVESDSRVWLYDAHGKLLDQRTFFAADQRPALGVDDQLIVTIGPPIGIDAANALLERSEAKRVHVAAYDRFFGLPDRPEAYAGVDWVIFTTRNMSQLETDSRAMVAIRQWVEMGGRLMISIGSAGESVLRRKSLWGPLAAATYEGPAQLRQIGALEAYCNMNGHGGSTNNRSDRVREIQKFELAVTRMKSSDAVVECRHHNLPLVMRRAHGFGRVTLVAFGLDSAALGHGAIRGHLLNRLLGRNVAEKTEQEEATTTEWRQHVYTDMSEQLADALDQFEAVPLMPFWLVVAIASGYLLLIGPFDYFLVHRILRRPSATWFTFTLTVILFAASTYATSRWLKGDTTHVNQITIVDVDLSSRATGRGLPVRSTTWLNLYSPEARRFNLRAKTASVLPAGVSWQGGLSWQGDPGAGLGAMRSTVIDTGFDVSYRMDPDSGTMHGVPVAARSTKLLTDQRRGTVYLQNRTSLTLDPHGQRPRGMVVNPLDVPLHNCVLFIGQQAFRLGTINANAKVDIPANLEPSTTRDQLTGREMIGNQQGTAYDLKELVCQRIVEVMMFHNAAGGSEYTDLSNRYQAFIDLSQHLLLRRAILIGVIGSDGIRLDEWPSHDPAATASVATTPIDRGLGESIHLIRFVFNVTANDDQTSPSAGVDGA